MGHLAVNAVNNPQPLGLYEALGYPPLVGLKVWVKSRRGCRNGEDFEESHRPFQIFIEILHLETRLNKKLRVPCAKGKFI